MRSARICAAVSPRQRDGAMNEQPHWLDRIAHDLRGP
jgi:hypothetical protein